ncbi:hypothetical protein DAPPUDRAFT_232816 [Daphnia pulex]|uniref:Uncharacterized protein n=1 Tax=Daphnia pulex TaxID=6669 RepID=E9FSF5_DAPPU|nr:hypothetical protein DAPPUDRAFT_232816 [Daphnia pulex]|eukprot:EFX89840.1 hypothetical protein DAPPUDRAFT_232816 [Daphnia pulex]
MQDDRDSKQLYYYYYWLEMRFLDLAPGPMAAVGSKSRNKRHPFIHFDPASLDSTWSQGRFSSGRRQTDGHQGSGLDWTGHIRTSENPQQSSSI